MNNKNQLQQLFNINIDDSTCIQDLIEAQTIRSPDALALICGDEELTYRQLNSRSNQLAHFLRSLGVGAEMLVGICMPRSIDMVIGILGILKAGGAYVPLDPAYPQERLRFILEDTKARFMIAQSDFLSSLPEMTTQIISFDTQQCTIAEQSQENLEKTNSSENLAYVIYTSGSTGRPKGVMIPHASLCHFVRIAHLALDVYPHDIYLHTASVAYALSVRQLMIPLSCGATIVLADSGQTHDPLLLFELIKKRNVTLTDMVPSFWRLCIQRLSNLPAAEHQNLLDNRLRRIVSIGEPLLSDISDDWRTTFKHPADLVNIFGQTETTGVVATFRIPAERQTPIGIVPIGWSIPETKLYVLDSDLKPVSQGETGELCVSSPCLARGYLNQPELTAQKFIPNPFHNDEMGNYHLYRTGDLVCLQNDGSIQFLGRTDHQVKIRGQRLELSEIEVVLRQHSAVVDCAVVARGDRPDNKRLEAFIVVSKNQLLTATDLRNFLRQRVPDYMLPSAFLFMDALPLTPNGKLDRSALPDLVSYGQSANAGMYSQPRNEIERKVSEIWKELLQTSLLGIHDDFFELGGHSFLAVRLFECLEKEFGIRFPLTTLFHATTIAQLSELIAKPNPGMDWSPMVPIRTTGSSPPIFGIHAQEGGVLFWRDIVSHLSDDQPFYAIQAQGVDGLLPARNRIEDMAASYVCEIRKIQLKGPYYLVGYSMGGIIAFEMGQQLYKQGERVDLLVMLDTKSPMRASPPVVNKNQSRIMTPGGIGQMRRSSALSSNEKVTHLIRGIQYRIKRVVVYSLVHTCRLFGLRVSNNLLLQYLRMAHIWAVRDYVPTSYPGRITLFRASESLNAHYEDSSMGWESLAEGKLDVFDFTATHELVNAEYAMEVAHKLTECMHRAASSP